MLCEILYEACQKSGIDPTKVTIRTPEASHTINIAYPSPSTTILSSIGVEDDKFKYERRIRRGEEWDAGRGEILLADPELIDKLAEVVKGVVSKMKSKFMDSPKKGKKK